LTLRITSKLQDVVIETKLGVTDAFVEAYANRFSPANEVA